MCILSNYDLFEEFFAFVKGDVTIEDTLKEYGGSSMYIPSNKTSYRNEEINKEYLEMQNNGHKLIAKKLARKHDLSEAQIYAITKEIRQEVANE